MSRISRFAAGLGFVAILATTFPSPVAGQKIAGGAVHTLLLKPDGSLWGFGANTSGQLEGVTGGPALRFKPFRIGSDSNWRSVTAGEATSYAIRTDGTLWAWGSGLEDAGPVLGDGTGANRSSPVKIGSDTDWKEIRVVGSSAFGLKNDGTLWAWGKNEDGSLGIGRGRNRLQYRPTAVSTETLWKLVVPFRKKVFSDFLYGGAGLDRDGKIYAWGNASPFTETIFYRPTLLESSSTDRWVSLAVSSFTEVTGDSTDLEAVAVHADGTLWKWEKGSRNQLGSDRDWVEVKGRRQHFLALKADGTLWSWGRNESGQLGLGDEDDRDEPEEIIQLAEGDRWVEVAAGDAHSLGLDSEGNFYAWGSNVAGQCGGENPFQKTQPVQIEPEGEQNWLTQAVAGGDFSLATRADGQVWAWGGGLSDHAFPQKAGEESNVGWSRGLASTDKRVLALDGEGRLHIWGNSEEEWPGLTVPWWDTARNEPGLVGTNLFKELSANGHVSGSLLLATNEKFAVGVSQSGSLYAWGGNSYGQLGDGSIVDKDFGSPAQVLPVGKWKTASAGGGHVLATRTDGTLWSWGTNKAYDYTNSATVLSGQLGIATITKPTGTTPTSGPVLRLSTVVTPIEGTPVPRQVGSSGDWAMVSAGRAHSLALKRDGSLWAWGYHLQGQAGVGYTLDTNQSKLVLSNQFIPMAIGPASSRWSWISAGNGHSAAIRKDGTLWAWGDNSYGQLGDGSRDGRVRPGQIGGANDWVRVWCGDQHTLALKKDGSLWAWGQNEKGQLGVGKSVGFTSPEPVEPTDVGGLSTLLIYSNRTQVGAGVVSFSFKPDKTNAQVSLHLDTGPATRQQIQEETSFQVRAGSLQLGSLKIGELSWPGRTNSRGFSLNPGILSRTPGRPQEYAGPARLVQTTNVTVLITNGTNVTTNTVAKSLFSLDLRMVAVLGGDEDADGIPDVADALPYGPKPKIQGVQSGARLRAVVGQPFLYGWRSQPGAEDYFIESQIPSGLSDAGGVLQGTPTRGAIGDHVLILAASNRAGTSYQAIGLRVVPAAPVITSDEEVGWTEGAGPFVHLITATENDHAGYPLVFQARDLPPRCRVDGRTGKLSSGPKGMVAPPQGVYRVLLLARHKEGRGSAVLTLRVHPADGVHGRKGERMRFAMRLAAGERGRYSATGLPPGLTIHPGNGWISGIPTAIGEYEVEATFRSRRGEVAERATLRIGVGKSKFSRQARREDPESGKRPLLFFSGAPVKETLEPGGRSSIPTGADAGRYAVGWEDVNLWKWNRESAGLATALSAPELARQTQQREILRQANPEALRLARITYESGAVGSWWPEEHVGWLRDGQGRVLSSAAGNHLGWIDFSRAEVVQGMAARVRHLVARGLVDGVYLPNWDEDSAWPANSLPAKGKGGESQAAARLELLRTLRAAVGPQGWIVAEAVGSAWGQTGPMLDGIHLVGATEPPPAWPPAEGWWPDPYMVQDQESPGTMWERLVQSLQVFGQEGVLRKPGNVMLELWARHDLKDARTKEPRLAGLAMSLCLSDGAYLYARPDWWQEKGKPVAPGEHLWFPEWSVRLGRPLDSRRSQPEEKGFYRRQFEHGWAAYVPLSLRSAAKMEFAEEVESVATGKSAKTHELLPGHGDLFLKKN